MLQKKVMLTLSSDFQHNTKWAQFKPSSAHSFPVAHFSPFNFGFRLIALSKGTTELLSQFLTS